MKHPLLACMVLLLAGCATTGPHATAGATHALSPDPAVAAVADRIANQYLAQSPIVGLSVTIARDARIVHDAAYGLASRSPDVPAGPAVPFELFSVGKTVTAVLLLSLAERELLDLDAAAGTYVRDLPAPYSSATLRQLLRHSAGNADWTIDENDPEPRFLRPPSRADLLAWFAEGRSAALPDETWLYDNRGFSVAGLVAEEVTGMRYGDLVRTAMAEPLQLHSFGYCPDLARTRAQGYGVVNSAVRPIPPIDFGWFGGAGSLCATTGDLARWWLAVRAGGLISPASLQEWMTPVALERNNVQAQFGYGLGMRLGSYGGHTVIGHTGDGAGGTAILAEYPDDRLLIVVASNTAGPDVPYMIEVQAAIARALLGIDETAPPIAAIGPESLATVPGLYRSPEGSFCVEAVDDALQVSTDEAQAVSLRHVGGGRFTRPGDESIQEYFLGWPDQTEWFGYAWFGLPMDLATRIADDCD
jgi:CubicO group peptidase (beta-lactamase class C family)